MAETNGALRTAVKACWPHLLSAAVFSALINLLYLSPTIYMLQVYDRVIPTGGMTTLAVVSTVTLFGFLTLSGLELVRSRLFVRCGARLDRYLAEPVMSTILRRTDLSRLQRLQLMRDYDTLRNAIAGAGTLAIFDAPWTPIYIIAAFLLSPGLGLLCIGASALLLALAWANEGGTHKLLRAANDAASLAYAQQDEASSYASEVRALGMCKAIITKQLLQRKKATDIQATASFRAAGYGATIRLARLTLQSAALGFGAYLAVNHRISPGAVMAASLLLARALSPIEQIVGVWRVISNARDVHAKLAKVLLPAETPARTSLPAPVGDITIDNVSVVAPQGPVLLLSGLSLSIKAGEMVAIVGHSGAGKSTLLKTVAGLLRPAAGCIRIDGVDTAIWRPEDLMPHIGYLPQDYLLFAGTIRDNISRFNSYLDTFSEQRLSEAVVAAAKAAGAHEMIVRLPQGYDTPVGLGGVGLSAGQTQRVALARALFGRPKILLLDEPNANLDTEGEECLIRTLAELRAQGTTILISGHRGAALSSADKLLMLQRGRLERYCTVRELLAQHRPAAPAGGRIQGAAA